MFQRHLPHVPLQQENGGFHIVSARGGMGGGQKLQSRAVRSVKAAVVWSRAFPDS